MTAQPSGAARGERQGSTAAASGSSTSALTTLAPAITQTGGSGEADARLNSEYVTQRVCESRRTRSPLLNARVRSVSSEPLATVIRTAATVSAMPSQFGGPSRSPRRSAAVRATKIGEAAPRIPAFSAVVYLSPQYQSVVLPTSPVNPRTTKAR